jgi:hypothetical protein
MALDDSANNREDVGKGLAFLGLAVGLLTGAAVYGVVEYWIDAADANALAAPVSVLLFIVTAAAAFLLLAEQGGLARACAGGLLIAALLILPDYFMAGGGLTILFDAYVAGKGVNRPDNLSSFPPTFWFLLGRSVVAYLLVALVKASFDAGFPPRYARVFFYGLTLPLIAAGAGLFAGLALVLLFAWASLLNEMDVDFFIELFEKPWFILPFLGGVGGLSVAMMRGQEAVLGALRYILLLFSRIVMPITAIFTITFLVVLAVNGAGAVFDRPYPAFWMIGLALVSMLIFHGVYQNGESGPPPLWLRLSTLAALLGMPVYTSLAFYALMLRVDEYGLTPPRMAGMAVTGVVAAYSIVAVVAIVSELNWRARRWMAPVAPMNTVMIALWILVLTALATPLANPWEISAQSQYRRLAENRASAEDFDYGYLRFELGRYGEKTLDKLLALENHPQKAAIREGVERARAAESYWEYRADTPAPTIHAPANGPMELELNPSGADTSPDDPDHSIPDHEESGVE